ncbi:MAG: hypothetical protein Q9208_006783 [Pyrenodesmia sp. 3 TL-2023]
MTQSISVSQEYDGRNSQREASESSPLLHKHSVSKDSASNKSSVSKLPPADRGKAAWLFLAGCFLIEGLIWGLPFSYGVFQKYYTEHEPFSQNPHGIAAIGTTTTGLLYFLSPVAVLALQRWPTYRMLMTMAGLALITVSLLIASFSTQVTELVMTQGALYGVGGAFVYNPFIFYLDEWFIERKGLAFGILWAGTGISGTIMPVVMDWGLETYGFRVTVRAWAVVMFVAILPLICLTKPRLPVPAKGTVKPLHLSFFRNTTFWIFQVGNALEGLGYFMPSIYLPTYASFIGMSSRDSTLAVSVLNCASVVGTIMMGSLTDHLHITTVLLISALGSAIAAFVLWGLAMTRAMLYVFALAYGVFAGGYAATWTGCVVEVQRTSRNAETGVVIGMMAATRGVGAVASGPLSEKLLGLRPWKGPMVGAYGTKYGILCLFTGSTALLGGLGAIQRIRLWNADDEDVESIGEIRRTHEDVRD